MNIKKRVLPALLFSIFAGTAATSAQAQQFSNVVVFGDSLSDAGYYRPFLASLGIPGPIVSQIGRFTTNPGPVWSELILQHYGLTPAPSNAGGTIYAQGGQRVTANGAATPPGQPQRPLSTQITEYLASTNGVADPNVLYTVWIGGNDFLENVAAFQAGAITAAQLQANVLGAAAAEVGQVGRLYQAGARYVVVFALPNAGLAPASQAGGAAAAAAATQIAAGYNTTLFAGLVQAGLRPIVIDTFSLLNMVAANPAQFGITNITTPACTASPLTGSTSSLFCLNNLVSPDAPQHFLFADSVHPTSVTHRILEQFVVSMIEGPASYSLLAEAPLRSRNAQIAAQADAMRLGQKAEIGQWTVFLTGGRGNFDVDDATGITGMGSDSNNFAVGATIRFSDSFMMGASYGEGHNKGTFNNDTGGFKTREKVWSIFGAFNWQGFYANGIVGVGDIRFDDLHRFIRLNTATLTANARPDGTNSSAYLSAGYDFPLGPVLLGPLVSVTTQSVDIDGFQESDAGAANLRISSQKRKSEVWSVGGRVSCNMGGAWVPWLRVTADKERKDEERLITASPLSLATGNSYDVPAYKFDTTYTTVALGVYGWAMPRVGFGLSYYHVSGRSGLKEEGVTGTVSVKF